MHSAWPSAKCDPVVWPQLVSLLRSVFLLVGISPTLIGRSVRRQVTPVFQTTAAESNDSKGNLLPMPVDVSPRADLILQHVRT